jgi:molecular chaperone DnaK (HSP70)
VGGAKRRISAIRSPSKGRQQFRNQTALTRLGEAYRHAGIVRQHFYPEPVAAAVSYLTANPEVAGEHVLLTLDFGGGTLDFCVLRRHRGGFDGHHPWARPGR